MKLNRKQVMLSQILTLFMLATALGVVSVSAITYNKYEYYDTTEDTYASVCGYDWASQTFNVTTAHTISYVYLELGKLGDPGTAIITIAETVGGEPSTPLVSGVFDSNRVVDDPLLGWYRIDLANTVSLSANTMYALIVSAPDGNYTSSDILAWATDSAGAYSRGTHLRSVDGGYNWNEYPAYDCLFEEWGYVYTLPILEAFPGFMTAVSAGLVVGILGFGFRDVGGEFGGHAIAGFIIGSAIGIVLCGQGGLIPVWFVIAIFMCGIIGLYFWFRGGG